MPGTVIGGKIMLGAALGEVLEDPLARLQRDLGHDAAHRLDEVEVRVLEAQLRVLAHERRRQRAELGEDLDARETAADHDDGEQTVARRAGREGGRLVEVRHDLVADRDGLFDRLETDGVVGDPREDTAVLSERGLSENQPLPVSPSSIKVCSPE